MRYMGGVFALSMSDVMRKESADAPLAFAMKSLYESSPASGTPMKFTRSLPANAIASANVPMRTTNLNTFTRIRWSTSMMSVEPMNV